jgi:hypothetical protein
VWNVAFSLFEWPVSGEPSGGLGSRSRRSLAPLALSHPGLRFRGRSETNTPPRACTGSNGLLSAKCPVNCAQE